VIFSAFCTGIERMCTDIGMWSQSRHQSIKKDRHGADSAQKVSDLEEEKVESEVESDNAVDALTWTEHLGQHQKEVVRTPVCIQQTGRRSVGQSWLMAVIVLTYLLMLVCVEFVCVSVFVYSRILCYMAW
jgi:hypothetical protein